jgi:hypothetical protein
VSSAIFNAPFAYLAIEKDFGGEKMPSSGKKGELKRLLRSALVLHFSLRDGWLNAPRETELIFLPYKKYRGQDGQI